MTTDLPSPAAAPPPAPAKKPSDLWSRVVVAVVAVPVLLFAIYQDRPEWVWALVFPASLLGMYEFFAMAIDDAPDRVAGLAIGAAACAAFYWLPVDRGAHLVPIFLALVPTAIYYVLRFGEIPTATHRITATVTGIVYGGLLFNFLAVIKRELGAGDWVLLVLVVPWFSDTAAYFAGRALGKRKMYPALSPSKTWAGAVGGLVGALVGAALMKTFRLDALSWLDVLVLGVPGGILCQLGDLFESLVKRSCGVKDSGTVLGGHGGILDRVDAVIVFAPYLYLYWLATHGAAGAS
jgi:phosphatidate cytidylyltransferase